MGRTVTRCDAAVICNQPVVCAETWPPGLTWRSGAAWWLECMSLVTCVPGIILGCTNPHWSLKVYVSNMIRELKDGQVNDKDQICFSQKT